MAKLRRFTQEPGSTPGSIVFVGQQKLVSSRIRVMDYNPERMDEHEVQDISDCFPLKDTPTVSWINIDGLHDTDMISKLADAFGFHPLMMEDIVNTSQRPKFEDFDDYILLTIRSLEIKEDRTGLETEHMSFILGPNYVISFQERVGDFFEQVRNRIRNGKGRIRRMGPDYLLYSLVDAIVDSYFVVLERIGERIEAIEDDLMENPTDESLEAIHSLKGQARILRRSIWPLREVSNGFERSESKLIKKPTHAFLRDLYDHTIQVVDTIETYRDAVTGLNDLYVSAISNRMNEIMKVLTIIATIFIPLTFIAGIYGMNFEYMPELGVRWAYFAVWGVIVVVGVSMLFFFRRLKWL
jgi:magnesium transporter